MTPQEYYQWITVGVGWSIIPILTVHYCRYPLKNRKEELKALFGSKSIRKHYLLRRGFDGADSTNLEGAFDDVFAVEFQREYGFINYLIPGILAILFSGLVIVVLSAQGLRGPIQMPALPDAVAFALLGAFFRTVWSITKGYIVKDLTPSTLYWISSRYILCIPVGLLANQIFAANIANLGAFVISTLPVEDILKTLKSTVGKYAPAFSLEQNQTSLAKLQGLTPSSMARLQEQNIETAQQLAYADPLRLLFQTNFDTAILIDSMDQAFLYNYVGDKIEDLRRRGIRGAIELASLKDRANNLEVESIAKVLEVTPNEVKYLTEMLYNDSQLRLIWNLSFASETR